MSVNRGPGNLIGVQDLLAEALAAAEDSGAANKYGIAIYPRTGRFDSPVFGVLTRGGESTTLTYRLLRSLMNQHVLISGRVPATLSDGTAVSVSRVPPAALLDQPALHVSIRSYIGVGDGDVERTMPLDSTVFAGELEAPIVFTMEQRPEGWPP